MQFKNISVKDIDFSCKLFRLLPVENSRQKSLYLGIKKNGILNPPILIEDTKKQKFIIVQGFKRLVCLLKSGETKTCALVMENNLDSFLKGFYLRCHDKDCETLEESVSFYAKSRLYDILLNIYQIFPEIDFEAQKKSYLGQNKNFIKKISVFSKLPFFVHKAFLNNVISLPVLLDLQKKYKIDDIKQILVFFQNLSPGLNRQRELLILLEELAHNEDKTVSELIEDKEIIKIISDGSLAKPQKLSMIIRLLNEKRFPEMIKLKTRFELLAKEAKLSENPKILSPRNFEDTNFKIELKFNNIETYLNLCKKMSNSYETGEINRFFELF
jgi:hypothetical protein